MNDIIERARKIKLLIMDCDGVLTDGRILMSANGDETKMFGVKDGHGIVMLHRAGLRTAIISGRKSAVVQARAKELGIHHLHEMAWVKLEPYEAILAEENLSDEAVCYVGDDVIDIPLLRRAGLAIAVADAVEEVKENAHYVTTKKGGFGAVREVVELILKAQGKWDELMKRYTEVEETVMLYRPIGSKELALIREANFKRFPPRLPEQPIFYPVLNEEYATKIARDWNAKYNTEKVGFVTGFRVRKDYLQAFEVQTVGGSIHQEYWIPADQLDEFNNNIVGDIKIIAEYRGLDETSE